MMQGLFRYLGHGHPARTPVARSPHPRGAAGRLPVPRWAAGRPAAAALTVLLSSAACLLAAESLLTNGDFERAAPGQAAQPLGWERPDGLGVQWITAPRTGTGGGGKAICMDTSRSERDMVARWKAQGLTDWDIPDPAAGPIAATYGLSYYSKSIPVASGQAYRVSFDYRSETGSDGAKVWVRAYGEFRGRLTRRYETIVNCRVENAEWTHFTQVFHPTRVRPKCNSMKVMLYAYWPPGRYWFDNVRIEPISNAEYDRERAAYNATRDE